MLSMGMVTSTKVAILKVRCAAASCAGTQGTVVTQQHHHTHQKISSEDNGCNLCNRLRFRHLQLQHFNALRFPRFFPNVSVCLRGLRERERERERISLVHSALAYEDASLLESSAKLRMAARQWQTAFWSLCHTKQMLAPRMQHPLLANLAPFMLELAQLHSCPSCQMR